MRSGIWPVWVSSAESCSELVANLRTSHAVPWFWHAVNSPTFLASLNVWMSPIGMPAEVGTGTAPQLTLPL